jgi:hypothetical protein
MEAVPSIRNLRTRHAVVTRDPPDVELRYEQNLLLNSLLSP